MLSHLQGLLLFKNQSRHILEERMQAWREHRLRAQSRAVKPPAPSRPNFAEALRLEWQEPWPPGPVWTLGGGHKGMVALSLNVHLGCLKRKHLGLCQVCHEQVPSRPRRDEGGDGQTAPKMQPPAPNWSHCLAGGAPLDSDPRTAGPHPPGNASAHRKGLSPEAQCGATQGLVWVPRLP